MGKEVLKDAMVLVGGYDISGHENALALNFGCDVKPQTVWTAGTDQILAGLKKFSFGHEGLFEAGADMPDPEMFGNLAQEDIMSIARNSTEGQPGFLFRGLTAEYSPGGSIGDPFGFSVSGESSQEPFVRGTILLNATKTASGNGTGYQVGSVAAGQSVYAALHVLTVSGATPTLDAIIQSDDNGGFSSPTTRITFAQATAAGAQWGSVAGAITDDYWRVNVTIGGTTPSFFFAILLGIQ